MKNCIKWLFIIIFIVLATSCKTKNIAEDTASISSVEITERENQSLQQVSEGYTVFDNHYHHIETHGDKIYVIFRRWNPNDDNDWSDALWCFSPYGKTKLIAEGKGLDFRVSQNNKYIAVEINNDIEIYSGEGELLHVLSSDVINTEEDVSVGLEQWNDDSNTLWCSLYHTIITMSYISIDPETLELDKYSDREFCSAEYVLNPNTGWIVYSDFPVTFDVEGNEEYMESGKMTTLSIYNLITKEQIEIESLKTNRFDPEWKSDNEIGYCAGYKYHVYRIP